MNVDRIRVGDKVGRTLYAQQEENPKDSDPLIGVMDTSELAAAVVRAWNAHARFEQMEQELALVRLELVEASAHHKRTQERKQKRLNAVETEYETLREEITKLRSALVNANRHLGFAERALGDVVQLDVVRAELGNARRILARGEG